MNEARHRGGWKEGRRKKKGKDRGREGING